MVAMTENDTVPSVQNLTEEKAGWLYFCPWYGEHLMSTAFNFPATLTTLYQSNYVITLDELPNLKSTTPVPSAAITPKTASFDRAANLQQDIAVTLTLNGRQLTSLTKGTATLVAGQDYTASGTTVNLRKAYLATLPLGANTITFHFNGGNNADLAVTVADSSTPVPSGNLTIQAYNGNTGASTNGIAPKLKIVNTGTAAIALSDVKLRYYYTIDGEHAQSFWCDWASIGGANVTGQFVKRATAAPGVDYYLEIGFTSAAGTLNPGQSAEIQARFSKTDWSNYNQSNDYSFDATSSQYKNNNHVTGYVGSQLTWGVEP